MALFREASTQPHATGAAATPAVLEEFILEANPVALANGMRLNLRATGATDTQAGTVEVELNHQTVLSLEITGAGAVVAGEFVIRRTGDTQGTIRGQAWVNGTFTEFPVANLTGLQWTRQQLFRIIGESDEEAGVVLHEYGTER